MDPRLDRAGAPLCVSAGLSAAAVGSGRLDGRRGTDRVAKARAPVRGRAMIARIRRLVWASWGPIAERAARAYVAGPALGDALRVCHALARQGFGATICPWDGPGDSSRQVADSYVAALGALRETALDCYLSIKAPSLEFSADLLTELLEAARPRGIGIHFDSLAPEATDQTWMLIGETAARYTPVGCTLPARWRRTLSDVRSEEHTSELQSQSNLVCRLLLEKKK